MAFKLKGTGVNKTKIYLQPTADAAAPGSRHWEYVTADAALVVEACGYIVTTSEDGRLAYDMLQVGDVIWVYTVVAILDTRPISDDKAGGITGLQAVVVVRKDADVLELSGPLFGTTTVSYTS